jgi:ParB family chromosome partitioning protein
MSTNPSAYPFVAAPLAQVFAAADNAVPLGRASTHLVAVPLYRIVPSRWQPRQQFDPAALLDLANDIAQHGVLTPPIVWQNEDMEYELIAGERRIRACYALFLHASGVAGKDLPKLVSELADQGFVRWRANIEGRIATADSSSVVRLSSVHCREIWGSVAQLHELALVDNLQRADLTAIEEAHAIHDLIQEYGYSQRDLAGRLGKSQTWISQRLNLINLAPAVADLVVAGELDASVARDVARVDPALQADLVTHIKKHNMRQKSAANLVANILELSQPEAWASDGGITHAYDVVIGQALAEAEPAERQRSMLKLAGENSDGRLARAHETFWLDKTLVAVGAAESAYQSIGKAFAAAAPALERTCETCQLNIRRPQIIEVQELRRATGSRDERQALSWPWCGMGETQTCPSHRTADERFALHVPYDSRIKLSDVDQAHIIRTNDWYQVTDDFPTWYSATCQKFRFEIATAAARKDAKKNGVAKALAGYIGVQDQIAADHVYSQPCANCVFHKRDAPDPLASCQQQQQPPELDWGQNVLATTWQAQWGKEAIVGRCRFYRLKKIGLLPDFINQVNLPPAAMLEILHRLSDRAGYGGNDNRSGPSWLDVARSKAASAPAWSACEPALKKLLPLLTPGQLYALLCAWNDVLPTDAATAEKNVFDPHLNREIAFRRLSKFEVAR